MTYRCEWCAAPVNPQARDNLNVILCGNCVNGGRTGFLLCPSCTKTFKRMMRQGHASRDIIKHNMERQTP